MFEDVGALKKGIYLGKKLKHSETWVVNKNKFCNKAQESSLFDHVMIANVNPTPLSVDTFKWNLGLYIV